METQIRRGKKPILLNDTRRNYSLYFNSLNYGLLFLSYVFISDSWLPVSKER